MKTLRFCWNNAYKTTTPPEGEIVLTQDPLWVKPCAWFEDFFDYPNRFTAIFEQAKEKSTNWAQAAPFSDVAISGIPYLEGFEHYVLSITLQILRDSELIHNLLEKERPALIVISGSRPDPITMIEAEFDTGLFEHTLIAAAAARGITVKTDPAMRGVKKQRGRYFTGWGTRLLGAVSAQIKAPRTDASKDNSRKTVIVAPSLFVKLEAKLIQKAAACGVRIILNSKGTHPAVDTFYSIAGRRVGVFKRLALYRRAMSAFRGIGRDAWRSVFNLEGVDYGEMVHGAISAGLKKYLWNECHAMLLFKAVLMRCPPVCMLVIYDHGLLDSCCVRKAKSAGVPVFTLQHGLFLQTMKTTFPINATTFMAWGSAERNILLRQGASAAAVGLSGYPFPIAQCPAGNSTAKRTRVLFATQSVEGAVKWYVGYDPTVRLIQKIAAGTAAAKNYDITIRLHPAEQLTPAIEELAQSAGITLSKGSSLIQQIADSDAVVTYYSSTGVEALLLNKPLVSVNWFGTPEMIPFAEEGAAVLCTAPEELFMCIDRAIEGHVQREPAIRRFIDTHICPDNNLETLFSHIDAAAMRGQPAEVNA